MDEPYGRRVMSTTTSQVMATLPAAVDDQPMTTITSPLATTTTRTEPSSAAHRLRTVLTVNAATSLVAGITGLAATDRLVDWLGLPSTGWTRVVSAGLVVFALDVALGARSRRHLALTALATSVADLAWVVATAVVVATVDLTGPGRVAAVALGVGVLDFAALQLWFRARLTA
jgi:hypothetical protein